MAIDNSIWSYFANAGPVVKMVLLILFAASVLSWTLIIERGLYLRRLRKSIRAFQQRFWAGGNITKLYSELTSSDPEQLEGLSRLFMVGFKEYMRGHKAQDKSQPTNLMLDGPERVMRIYNARATDKLEQHLSWLATIGSTSPYIGLFGTVWGIMTSFHALGNVQQATIAMVAPGISEALIATAMGLFAAIPAVIAYNRFTNEIERLLNDFDNFQQEFIAILNRQSIATTEVSHE